MGVAVAVAVVVNCVCVGCVAVTPSLSLGRACALLLGSSCVEQLLIIGGSMIDCLMTSLVVLRRLHL